MLEGGVVSDLGEITERQRKMWSIGDFHRIGVSQVVVGEMLVRSLRVHAQEWVLDVAGGAGNTALAAARRWADVICSDYVPELLRCAERRTEAEGLPLRTQVADAQQLPFDDGTFDVVTSTFGAMFAPDPVTYSARTAARAPRGRPVGHGQLAAEELGRCAVRSGCAVRAAAIGTGAAHRVGHRGAVG